MELTLEAIDTVWLDNARPTNWILRGEKLPSIGLTSDAYRALVFVAMAVTVMTLQRLRHPDSRFRIPMRNRRPIEHTRAHPSTHYGI